MWIWRFTQEDSSLWKKVISSIFGVSPHGWMTIEFKGKRGNRSWVDIAMNFPFFTWFVRLKVGHLKNIRFWEDSLVNQTPLKISFLDIYALSYKKRRLFFIVGTMRIKPRTWVFGEVCSIENYIIGLRWWISSDAAGGRELTKSNGPLKDLERTQVNRPFKLLLLDPPRLIWLWQAWFESTNVLKKLRCSSNLWPSEAWILMIDYKGSLEGGPFCPQVVHCV